ncbi:hypothetical protein E5676_scaffold441G00110 [Cucumis melo var. makuwa]|uniref:Uncharacterized protein n=1 Tax=Cucumis melo var. makuwa TaxID=1194695 RepID=A0A5D3B6L8_CUCMM|nr:hypothetical protein E5676_scaffold441G00110 [Cucumis melo var. makuwa]
MLHRFRGLHYYFSMSKFEIFIDASSYSSSKASSTLPHIQARKVHRCFLIFKLEGFINAFTYSSLKALSTLAHIQARRLHRCFLIYAALPPLQNINTENSTSSQICCSREDHHFKYVAAEKIVISNMLQSRRSSSQICCSQEDLHLQ